MVKKLHLKKILFIGFTLFLCVNQSLYSQYFAMIDQLTPIEVEEIVENVNPIFEKSQKRNSINVASASCVTNYTINLDASGSAILDPADLDNGSTGAGVLNFSADRTNFGCTDITLSPITVTLTVTDTSDNSTDTCTVQVSVEDNLAPIITCPSPATSYNVDAGDCDATLSFTATATDNCNASPTITYQIGGSTITFPYDFPVGTTTVTAIADDGDTNSANDSCTFDIVVLDNEAPIITCPGDMNSVSVDAGQCSSVVTYTAPTGTDNCSNVVNIVQTAGLASGSAFPVGTTINTFVVTDVAGNTATCSFNVTVVDNEDPTASNPASIIASGVAPDPDITVVIDEADNCTANPIVAFVSDSLSGSCPVNVIRTYSVTDNAGNSINVTQNITVNDAIPPIAICVADYTVSLTLDGVTGLATLLPSQIDNGSTDDCGSFTLSLDKTIFGCNDIGVNDVQLTVTDDQGNIDTCTTKITINAPTIDSGTLTGYIVQTETIADASDVIDITACPTDTNGNTIQQDIVLNLAISPALAGSINRWEYSTNGGITWSSISNTSTTHTVIDVTVTTLVRVVIDVGDCLGFSPIAVLAVVPPDIPPTIVNGTEHTTNCLGDNVTVVVESAFGVGSEVNNGGLFNSANLNNLGWIVDGEEEMSAGGNNTNDTYWKETNGPKTFNGRCYDVRDNTKFAIVSGIPPYINQPNNKHLITPLSTLETPIFSTLGLTEMQLEFDQAYYLEDGAWIKIEISTDGGANYDIELSYTEGAASTVFDDNLPGGQCNGSSAETYLDEHISIDLQNYIGLTNLRIRFSYFAGNPGDNSGNSSWAIDNIQIPNNPVDEVIEWTDDFGVVVATGSTVNITTVTPGVQNYGATSLINGCRSDDDSGTEFITIESTLSYAGENIVPLANECGEDVVTLAAYDNTITAQENYDNGVYNNNYKVPNIAPASPNYPATGEIGTWSVTSAPSGCGTGAYTFSNINDPNATFTGEPGTYTLTWTVNGCASNVDVTINSCSQIDFDGVNDYITFKDNYDLTGAFSIEMWVKPQDLIETQSLLSKRNGFNLAEGGYDLRLTGNTLAFHWDNSSISSNHIDAITWHHIAVTFNGTVYKLYINGVEKDSANGSAPTANSMECILGAMDQANNPPNKPVNYFHGWIDELRIWNKALDVQHIRQMMNQEIKLDAGDDVIGEIIPIKISGPDADQNGTDDDVLLWSNLEGYYRMGINCGYLTPTKGSLNGRLRNITSDQQETAPLPYISDQNGDWDTNATWDEPVVWYIPNSTLFGTEIDWNIVHLSHNITSGARDITLLGLFSDSGELTIDGTTGVNGTGSGQMLWITHYLSLNGVIDLEGESQLLQKRYNSTQFSGSILNAGSTGHIERDQQGTRSSFNYNYWSSPVIQTGTSNMTYTVAQVMRDGTTVSNPKTINFVGGAFSADGVRTDPITVSTRWLYTFNGLSDQYSEWNYIGQNGAIQIGDGFTMKGVDGTVSFSDKQNYIFIGKPNNGGYTLNIAQNDDRLVGNPCASAMDADEFILDNLAGRHVSGNNIFNGTVYFWHHFSGQTHYLAEYVGGYAAYNLTGGVEAVSTDYRINANNDEGNVEAQRFIPVGQGFFVYATHGSDGGAITFKNSQRVFERETFSAGDDQGSYFFKSSSKKNNQNNNTESDDRPKFKLKFSSPLGYHRPILAGIDEKASNQIEFGFDAYLADNIEEDMFWVIDDEKFVIQGVNNFNKTQELPIGIRVKESGLIKIEVKELINLDESEISIYVKDAIDGETYEIISNSFELNLEAGEYLDRFSIVFQPRLKTLDEVKLYDGIFVHMNEDFGELEFNRIVDTEILDISLYNYIGQQIRVWNKNISERQFSLPVNEATGVYIVQINTSNGLINKKIIIEKNVN